MKYDHPKSERYGYEEGLTYRGHCYKCRIDVPYFLKGMPLSIVGGIDGAPSVPKCPRCYSTDVSISENQPLNIGSNFETYDQDFRDECKAIVDEQARMGYADNDSDYWEAD